MDTETVVALAAIMVAVNAPFYLMSLSTVKTLARLQAVCPLCREQDQAGDPKGGEKNGI